MLHEYWIELNKGFLEKKKMWVKFVWYSLNCFLEKFKFDMKLVLVLLNYS